MRAYLSYDTSSFLQPQHMSNIQFHEYDLKIYVTICMQIAE